jgi:serine/threonine protein phosphatase PrpC
MRFSVYQISRKGGREKNEDRMGYCYTRDSGLFALADGMGGHPEGEMASQPAPPWLTRSVFCKTPSWPATTSCCAMPVKKA